MIKEKAISLRLGLERGFVSLEEIEKWADGVLQSDYPYEDWLGEVSTASQLGVPKTYSILGTVSGDVSAADLWTAFSELLTAKLKSGEVEPAEAHAILTAQGAALPPDVASALAGMAGAPDLGSRLTALLG